MKYTKVLLTCLLSALFVTACGTTKTGENQGKGEKPADRTHEQTEREDKENTLEKEQEDDQKIRLMERNLSYEINSNVKEETAFLRESDNQGFSLYVLPEYELTGEEPQKDILYFKENDSQFMRIELLPSDTSVDEAADTAKAQLESVNSEMKQVEPDQNNKWLQEASIFSAGNKEDKVSVYLIPTKDRLLKLTIFTSAKQQMEDPFLKMGETIEHK